MTETRESHFSISELVDGLIARDDKVWREFLEISGPFINGVSRKNGLNYDEIRDISQVFVLKLLEHDCRILRSAKFESRNGFYSWAKVVLTRIILDYIRENESRRAREHSRGQDHLKKSLASDGSDELEMRMKVEEITGQLNEQEQTIFWLIYSGLKSHEMARILGMNLDTIQKRVSRLKNKIRGLIAGVD